MRSIPENESDGRIADGLYVYLSEEDQMNSRSDTCQSQGHFGIFNE